MRVEGGVDLRPLVLRLKDGSATAWKKLVIGIPARTSADLGSSSG